MVPLQNLTYAYFGYYNSHSRPKQYCCTTQAERYYNNSGTCGNSMVNGAAPSPPPTKLVTNYKY